MVDIASSIYMSLFWKFAARRILNKHISTFLSFACLLLLPVVLIYISIRWALGSLMAVGDLPNGGVYLWMKHEVVNDLSNPSFDVLYTDMSHSLLFARLVDFLMPINLTRKANFIWSLFFPESFWSQQKQPSYYFQLVLLFEPMQVPKHVGVLVDGLACLEFPLKYYMYFVTYEAWDLELLPTDVLVAPMLECWCNQIMDFITSFEIFVVKHSFTCSIVD